MIKRLLALLPWQFIKFGIVGAGGYVVDVIVLKSLQATGMDPYSGQAIAFIVAASYTWCANRFWTFRQHRGASAAREWGRYLLVMVGGFAVNYSIYAGLVTLGGIWQRHTELAVAVGTLGGLAFNFPASKKLVFKVSASERPASPASPPDP